MNYLLDSNIWMEILKGKNLKLIDRFTQNRLEEMARCSPVRAEIMHGAEKYEDAEIRKRVISNALSKVISLPFDD